MTPGKRDCRKIRLVLDCLQVARLFGQAVKIKGSTTASLNFLGSVGWVRINDLGVTI